MEELLKTLKGQNKKISMLNVEISDLKKEYYQLVKLKDINDYLKKQNLEIREKMIEIIMGDICIHCYDVNSGLCHCCNDE